jgi:hypothetical protein
MIAVTPELLADINQKCVEYPLEKWPTHAVLALISEIERLRAENDRLNKHVGEWRECSTCSGYDAFYLQLDGDGIERWLCEECK